MSKEEVVISGYKSGNFATNEKGVVHLFIRFSGQEVELDIVLPRPMASEQDMYQMFDPLFRSFAAAVANGASQPLRLR